jgi:CRP/FNR family transcriptional regulator, cyclic AMP receptor protein
VQRAPLVICKSLRNYPAMPGAPPEDRATFPLFGSLNEADAASVRSLLRRRQVEAGATVFQRGDIADTVYLVVSGQLRISVGSANGRELAFRVIGPGDMVGEMGVLDGGRRSADLTALRQSVMLGLSRSALQTLLATRPAIASGIIAFLCARLRETSEQMEALALQTIEARLARLLLRLTHAGDHDLQQDVSLVLDMSQTEIATLIGASRPKVNIAFRELERRGAIQRTGRNLQCRIQALEEVAEIADP